MKDSCGSGMQQEAFPFPTKNFLYTKTNQTLFKAQDIFTGEDIIPFLLEGWEWLPQGQGTAKVINTKHTMTNSNKHQPRTYLAWN